MHWTGDLWGAFDITDDPAGQHERFFMRTHLLARVPFASVGEIEYGDLNLAVPNGRLIF